MSRLDTAGAPIFRPDLAFNQWVWKLANRLCCTNRLEAGLALTPDGFSLPPVFGVCQVL